MRVGERGMILCFVEDAGHSAFLGSGSAVRKGARLGRRPLQESVMRLSRVGGVLAVAALGMNLAVQVQAQRNIRLRLRT